MTHPQKASIGMYLHLDCAGVAMGCSGLQWVAVGCSGLRCVAVCCSALQCVAVYCSVWQCVAVRCFNEVLKVVPIGMYSYPVCVSVAVYCSVLQCIAVCCSALQHASFISTHSHTPTYSHTLTHTNSTLMGGGKNLSRVPRLD